MKNNTQEDLYKKYMGSNNDSTVTEEAQPVDVEPVDTQKKPTSDSLQEDNQDVELYNRYINDQKQDNIPQEQADSMVAKRTGITPSEEYQQELTVGKITSQDTQEVTPKDNDPDFFIDPAKYIYERVSKIGLDNNPTLNLALKYAKYKLKEVKEPKKQTDFEYAKFYSKRAKKGLAGMLSVAGFIPSAGTGMANLIQGSNNTNPIGFGAQQKAWQQILNLDFDTSIPKPIDDFTRYTGTLAEFAGGSLLPSAAIISKAPDLFAKSVAAFTEGSSILGGALGTEGGGDASAYAFGEEYRGAGEVIGGISLTLAPYGTKATIQNLTKNVQALFNKDVQKQIGREKAHKLINHWLESVPDAMNRLERSNQLSKNITGNNPSLGDITGSAAIRTEEKRLAKLSQENMSTAINAEIGTSKAIDTKSGEFFPKNENLDLTIYPDEFVATTIKNSEKELSSMQDAINKLTPDGSGLNPQVIGEETIKLRSKMEKLAKNIKDKKYDEFYYLADKSGVEMSSSSLVELSKSISKNENLAFQSKSKIFKEIMDKYIKREGLDDIAGKKQDSMSLEDYKNIVNNKAKVQETISVREYHSLLKRTRSELRDAHNALKSGGGDSSLVGQLTDLKRNLRNQMDELKTTSNADVAKSLDDADIFYKDKYQNVFFKGLGGKMVDENKFGLITAEDKIYKNLVLDRGSNIDDFKKIYGDSDEAMKLLSDGIADRFIRKSVDSDDVFNPKLARQFIRDNDVVLNKLPAIKDKLSDHTQALQLINNRMAQRTQELKDFSKSRISGLTGAENSIDLLEKALTKNKDLDALVNTVKLKGGEQGSADLRSVFAEIILKQKDPFQYILDNTDKVKKIFNTDKKGKEHFKNIMDLAEAKKINNKAFDKENIHVNVDSIDPLDKIGLSTKEVASTVGQVHKRFVSKWWAGTNLGTKMFFKRSQNEMDKIFMDIFYSNNSAKLLKEGFSGKIDPAVFGFKLQKHLLAIGARANIAVQPRNEDQKIQD